MAQWVGYYDDNIVYVEGPFVICGGPVGAKVGRIECEFKGHHTCVTPHASVRPLIDTKRRERVSKAAIVDYLNSEAREGRIVCNKDGVWVVKENKDQ